MALPYPAAMTDPAGSPALTGEALETWASLATVLEWLPAALDGQLQRDADLSHFEYGLMYALSAAPDRRLRMSVLAGYAHCTLSRLSRATTRLEARGWVRREPDPRDGRYTLAVLTEAGQRRVHDATPGHVRTVQELVLDPLTSAQVRQLREISRRILRALGDEKGWQPPSGPASR